MQITKISLADNAYYQKSYSNSTTNFRGTIGDKFVNRIIHYGHEIKAEQVLKEINGTLGINKNKAIDVLESFINKISELSNENIKLKGDKADVEQKFESYKLSTKSMLKRSKNILTEKNDIINMLKKQPVPKVKTTDEIGYVKKPDIMKAITDSVLNVKNARKSMFTYLTTGKGQEDALSQIDRLTVLRKAYKDGMLNDPEIEAALESDFKKYYLAYDAENALKALIKDALKNSPDADWAYSKGLQNQIKDNAKAILFPNMDGRWTYSATSDTEKLTILDIEIPELIERAKEDRINFEKGFKYWSDNYKKLNWSEANIKRGSDFMLDDTKIKLSLPAGSYADKDLDYDRIVLSGSKI